jgi:hypothetical protein
MLTVAREVARYLPGWRAVLQASDWAVSAILAGPVEGARVALTVSDGKLHMSGCYPATEMRVDYRGINVTVTRPPAIIAGEIERRLLPGYLRQLAEVVTFNARMDRERAARTAVMERIAGMFPGAHVDPASRRGTHAKVYIHPARCTRGMVEAYGSAATVSIELSGVPVDLAAGMLAVLASWRPEGVWFRVEDDHPRWEIKNPHGDGRNYLCTDEAIRTYGREHMQTVVLRDLPQLPEGAWSV